MGQIEVKTNYTILYWSNTRKIWDLWEECSTADRMESSIRQALREWPNDKFRILKDGSILRDLPEKAKRRSRKGGGA